MSILSPEQISKSKNLIFRQGRLLDRKLYEHFFENGSSEACIRALLAYQNADNGFGNGIEPDLLCPDSTAIGAETAMYVLELLDHYDAALLDKLVSWIEANQTEGGLIEHPPESMFNYPYQPWWKNPDEERVLVLAGMLRKWGIDKPEFFEKVRNYYLRAPFPEEDSFFSHPFFVYLAYCSETAEDRAKLERMTEHLPVFLEKHRDHYPLFSRYWYFAKDYVGRELLDKAAQTVARAIQKDGGIVHLYPDLPLWQPIFTLDALILLKKWSFL